MRLKHVLEFTRLPAQLKLFWDRVTFSKITIIYFIFSIIHCLLQVIFQSQAFAINADAAHFLSSVIQRGNASISGFAVLGPDLRMCDEVPTGLDASSCPIIWNGRNMTNTNAALQMPGYSSGSSSAPSGSATSLADNVPSTGGVSSSSVVSAVPAVSSAVLSSSVLLASSVPSASATLISRSSEAASSSAVASPIASSRSSSAISNPTPIPGPAVSQASSALVSVIKPTVLPSSSVITTAPASSTSPPKFIDDDDDDDSDDDESDAGDDDKDDLDDDDDDKVKSAQLAAVRSLGVVLAASPTQVIDNPKILWKRGHPQIVGSQLDSEGQTQVTITGLNGSSNSVTLDQKCVLALNWPVAIFASLLTHIIATGWAGYQIFNTREFRANFNRLTTQGACGVNLLPTYWQDRGHAEIPSLALNIAALVISAFLSWRLIKLFGWQTFKRVGASLTINRVYNVVLVQSIVIQLSLFFIVISGALWIDQILNAAIGRLSTNVAMHKGVISLVLILLVPWLAIGWIAMRREHKRLMLVFLALSFLYLVGWAAMFAAPSFRWTFVQWKFFALMATASVVLTLTTLILGIVCRMNFGKGLARYLNAEDLPEDDFSPVNSLYYEKDAEDVEKVAFPSTLTPVPTFSAAFGRGPEVPPPSQMRFGPRTNGPRFYKVDASPFEDPTAPPEYRIHLPTNNQSQTTISSMNYNNSNISNAAGVGSGYGMYTPNSSGTLTAGRYDSGYTTETERSLVRQGSAGSQRSVASLESHLTTTTASGRTQGSRRWVIE
ncbi:hypothetical protein NLI96_g4437 [Meripilus lineatus]|uniref:Integral membrane protein n=1 Tax=Meripilus lineatus TaxID=2056292 RepID=A0AAD5YER7_9APHY|nr:hypothetical protein NLI96_g4437 [Physisporinus lineatus]